MTNRFWLAVTFTLAMSSVFVFTGCTDSIAADEAREQEAFSASYDVRTFRRNRAHRCNAPALPLNAYRKCFILLTLRVNDMNSLLILLVVSGSPDVSKPQNLRQAVDRGVEFIAKAGPASQKSGCIQCHHGPFTIWAQRESKGAGYEVDNKSLVAFESTLLKRFEGASTKKNWLHSLAAFFVLGQPNDWQPNNETAKFLTQAITTTQQEAGNWKAASQFSGQTRPKGEGDQLQTLWNVVALKRLDSREESVADAMKNGLAWVSESPQPESIDARSVRALVEFRFGDKAKAKEMLSHILEDQNEDGSWGWTAGKEGDAWGTGVALYVLGQLRDVIENTPETDKRIDAAQKFLAATQLEDGSWMVPSKLKKSKKEARVASFFGTAWSVMGLARTID